MISRESAIAIAIKACREIGAQFLDQTVVLRRIWLCRNANGRIKICRIYCFDFTLDGNARLLGCVTLRGQTLEDVLLDIENYIDSSQHDS